MASGVPASRGRDVLRMTLSTTHPDVEARAQLSAGHSDTTIYRMVARAVARRGIGNATLIDVGCGRGALRTHVAPFARRYIGIDAVRYEGIEPGVEFHQVNLDRPDTLADLEGTGDVVVAVETIEHLENPRAFLRLLVRMTRPGGWVIATTPNVRSALSLATLVVRGQFSQFQDVHYPAHLSPMLEVDLRRIASEIALDDVAVEYSERGRMVFTPWHYPSWLSRQLPRACSDNLLLAGRRST